MYDLTNLFKTQIYHEETGKIKHDAAQPIKAVSHSSQPISVEERGGEPITAEVSTRSQSQLQALKAHSLY